MKSVPLGYGPGYIQLHFGVSKEDLDVLDALLSNTLVMQKVDKVAFGWASVPMPLSGECGTLLLL